MVGTDKRQDCGPYKDSDEAALVFSEKKKRAKGVYQKGKGRIPHGRGSHAVQKNIVLGKNQEPAVALKG